MHVGRNNNFVRFFVIYPEYFQYNSKMILKAQERQTTFSSFFTPFLLHIIFIMCNYLYFNYIIYLFVFQGVFKINLIYLLFLHNSQPLQTENLSSNICCMVDLIFSDLNSELLCHIIRLGTNVNRILIKIS